MTIKEAFQLLADKISSGMKNPFIIARNLHDACAEIAEKVEGGGGGDTVDAYDVTYQQSTVGATLEYIQQGIQYSTTKERYVGRWIDGKAIYQKTWADLSIASSGNNWVYFNTPTDIENIISFNAFSNNSGKLLKCAIAEVQRSDSNGIMFSSFSGFDRTVNVITAQYTKVS